MSADLADSTNISGFSKCYFDEKQNKGMLHLIPNNPHWISGNAAFWTAGVHGHKNIYLLGYDFREYGKEQLNNIYQDTECYGERHDDKIFEGLFKIRFPVDPVRELPAITTQDAWSQLVNIC